MRTPAIVLTLLMIGVMPVAAQHEHRVSQAADSPLWLVMAERYHAGLLKPQPAPESTRVPEGFSSSAAKTFTIIGTINQTWDISPLPFAVDQGDMVTIKIRADIGIVHGFFLQRYDESGAAVTSQERTITFFADTPGSFFFFCTIFCGNGHGSMGGQFVVNSVQSSFTVTGFSPTSGPTTGGTSVTISGTNFVNGATVRFGNQPATAVTFVNATTLIATTPSQAAGNVSVTVTNPDNQSATSPTQFTYVFSGPAITSVTPSSGTTAGGTAITISGSGFQSGATLLVGTASATNVVVVDSATITARTPLGPSDTATASTRDVRVVNPDGTAAIASSAFAYTIPTPTIANISPAVSTTAGGGIVTITGTGFTTALPTTVTFGGTAGTNVQVVDALTLRVVAPAHGAGTVNVLLQVGSNTVTATGGFRYESTAQSRRRSVRH